jgi:hypothetical protein
MKCRAVHAKTQNVNINPAIDLQRSRYGLDGGKNDQNVSNKTMLSAKNRTKETKQSKTKTKKQVYLKQFHRCQLYPTKCFQNDRTTHNQWRTQPPN